MRILFSTWPALGHLLPLMPMARAAQGAGHEIVVASGREGVIEAGRLGLPTWEVGPSRAQAEEAFRATAPDLSALPPHERMRTIASGIFGAAAFRRAAELLPLAVEWKPDLVVHPISELAGAVVAVHTGARHVVHGMGPLPAESFTWFGSRFEELCRTWEVPALTDALLDVPYLDNCPPSLQADAVAAFRNRRPLRPGSGDPMPGERLPWSAEQLAALPFPHTVHLTLGTMFNGATHVFRAALEGMRDLPVNVLVTMGPGGDPAQLGPQPPHVLVTDFAPHALLLPHCDGLVTQGGAGTIVAALCHGLPHLILPQGADQFANAAVAQAAGVALTLTPAEATPQAIRFALRQLLDDDGPLRAAHAVRAEIGGMPSADDVLARILADRRP
jgi:UDP:flavonoid glycosyltransferase YjiC (YdhE family)